MSRDYITVAEYAELRGISVQAVYKALKGKLINYGSEVEIDGKLQKVLAVSVLSPEEYTRFLPRLVEPFNGESTESKPTVVNQDKPETTGAGGEWFAAAFEERGRRVADLEGRVQEQAQMIAALREELAEKDKYIQSQSEKLSELLSAALQLQPGNLLLMGAASRGVQENQSTQGAAANYEDIPAGAQTVQAEPAVSVARRRGFWARLFGK